MTIPTAEYRALRAAAAKSAEGRNAVEDGAAWVEPAEIVLRVEGETARFVETFRARSDAAGWARIPLSDGEGFEAASIQPETSASVVPARGPGKEGGFHIALRGPGTWTGRLERTIPSTLDSEGRRIFAVSLPLFPVQRGRIEIPGTELDVTVTGGELLARGESKGGTSVEFAGGAGAEVTISIREKTGRDRRREAALRTSAVIGVRTTVVGGDLVADATIRLTATSGEIPGIEVGIPTGWRALYLRGPGLLITEETPERIAAERLDPSAEPLDAEVRFVRPVRDEREIELPIPTVAANGGSELYADIRPPDGSIAEALRTGSFDVVEPERIPPELRARLGDSDELLHLRRRESSQRPAAYRLHRIGAAEVLTAQVRSMFGRTILSRTGRALTRIELEVVASAKPFLTLHLPAGYRFWSAEAAGRPIVPAAPDGERIALPLRAGRGRLARLAVTLLSEIELPAKGTLSLAVPWCDVPVSSVQWAVTLPAGTAGKLAGMDPVWQDGFADASRASPAPAPEEAPDTSAVAVAARAALAGGSGVALRTPISPRVPPAVVDVAAHAHLPSVPFPPLRIVAEEIRRKEDWR